MKKIRIIIEYLAAFLIIFILLSVIASVVVVKFYGDDVQDYTMELINDQLDTKISIDEMGISIFRKFPNTALFFNNVTIWSGHYFNRDEFQDISADTLFIAKRLYLEFNIIGLLKKEYSIRSMEARDGLVRILIDSTGNSNFLITKKKSNQESPGLINMKGVVVKGIDVQYINKAKDIQTNALLKEIHFEGNFSNRDYLLKVGGTTFIDLIQNHGITYLSKQEIKTDISMEVEKNLYKISKGKVMLGDLSAAINGEFLIDPENGVDMDLHFVGKHIDIGWITDILEKSNTAPGGLTGKGNLDLTVDISGLATPMLSPHIEANFSTKNAYLKEEDFSVEFNAISLDGSYTNGPFNSPWSTTINISSYRVEIGSSSVSGALKLENLIYPSFEASIRGEINGSEISNYFPDIPIHISKGTFKPDLSFKGQISKPKEIPKNITFTPTGSVEINDLFLKINQTEIKVDSLNGVLSISNKELAANISGYLDESDFLIDLSTSNPFTSTTDLPQYNISGSLYSSNINIDQLLSGIKKDEGKNKSSFTFPENIKLHLEFLFDKIVTGEIQTKQVSGIVHYNYPAIYLDPLNMETMEGSINSQIALIDLHKPVHAVNMSTTFRNIEIQHLFKSFNNFGQTFLTSDNIAGSISGESDFISSINSDFSINTEDIISKSNFTIVNGELNNFQPMIELSGFLKIDKMDHILFSNISNKILINNNKITIPEMEINSSAINIKASGTHGFDKTYSYHLATKLSEILFNKAKSSGKQEFNIALDTDDKRTVFLHLYDEGDGVVIEFDEDQVMKKIKSDLKEEKNELKTVLNKEFGLFKNEEHIKEQNEEPVFRFEFPDDNSEDSVKTESVKKSRWWKRKGETDKKPELKFVIDDDDI